MDSKTYELAKPVVTGTVVIGVGIGAYFLVKKILDYYWAHKAGSG